MVIGMSPVQERRTTRRKPNVRTLLDILLIVCVAGAAYLVGGHTDAFEQFLVLASGYEYVELDEIISALVATSFVLAGILILRVRDLSRLHREQQEIVEELERERLWLRTLIDLLPDYIFIKDVNGAYLVTNLAHAEATHAETTDELIGKTAFEVFPEPYATEFTLDDKAVMARGEPLINVVRHTLASSGQLKTVLTTKVPIRNAVGRIVGLVGISRDVTELQEELTRRLETAREDERGKMMTSFMQDAAHDFRTPLSTISTSVYLLEKAAEPEKRSYHASVVMQQIHRLERLLEGLTTMTRLDSLQKIDKTPVQVNTLLAMLPLLKQRTYAERDVHVQLDLAAPAPVVMASETDLYEAIKNVFDNAIHFTPDGGTVTVRSHVEDSRVVIEIRDTGTGISAEDLLHIFDRFYRVDRARATTTGGIGLGLPIAKKIIELHGGTIAMQSTKGQGACCFISLPLLKEAVA